MRGNTRRRSREIVIGLNTVMSGVLKTVGETTVTAVEIAVDEINAKGGIGGKKIKLVKFDTGSDPKQAATGTQKFAQDDKALAIIGPFSSGEAAVAFPVGERLGIVEIPNAASTPGLTKGFSYAWRLTADEGTQFTRLLKTLGKKGIKHDTAEIIYVSDERVSNISGTTFYPAILKANNVSFGQPIGIQLKSFDVSPQVAQALERKPDVVAVAGTPDSAGKVIKELRRQGFHGPRDRLADLRRPELARPVRTRCGRNDHRRGLLVGPQRRDARLHQEVRRRKTQSAGSPPRRSRTTPTRRPTTSFIC